jgi:hypothetical protein
MPAKIFPSANRPKPTETDFTAFFACPNRPNPSIGPPFRGRARSPQRAVPSRLRVNVFPLSLNRTKPDESGFTGFFASSKPDETVSRFRTPHSAFEGHPLAKRKMAVIRANPNAKMRFHQVNQAFRGPQNGLTSPVESNGTENHGARLCRSSDQPQQHPSGTRYASGITYLVTRHIAFKFSMNCWKAIASRRAFDPKRTASNAVTVAHFVSMSSSPADIL